MLTERSVGVSSASCSSSLSRDDESESSLFSPAAVEDIQPAAQEVSSFVVEADSVPFSPMYQQQESRRRADREQTLPESTLGLLPRTLQQTIGRYQAAYERCCNAEYNYVVAVVNPGSGSVQVSKVVLEGLRDELGTRRVVILRGEIFANPAPLRLLIKQQAVIYHSPDGPPAQQQRGTVVVSGGDGTISFMMTQLDLVRQELEAEFDMVCGAAATAATAVSIPTAATTSDEISGSYTRSAFTTSRASRTEGRGSTCFTVPALAPLPLGTGNDFSNCVGFGSGFNPRGSSLWGNLCGFCSDSEVSEKLRDAVSAPHVPFDRWEVTMVPLRLAQASLQGGAGGAEQGVATGMDEPALSSAQHQVRWQRGGNAANAVHLVDWAGVRSGGRCTTHGLINYLGVGYDAYVTCKFDTVRREHPAICSTRANNKAVYGVMGVKGAMKCKCLRKLLPMVCVAQPSETEHGDAGVANRSNMVALQLPSSSKALVLTNVDCYSAGTHPWQHERGEMYYHPVSVRDCEMVREEPPLVPVARPVQINDGQFELQAMGGVLHYGTMGLGLSRSTKITQTNELFIFVLCTPDDLKFPPGQCSSYTQVHLKNRYEDIINSDAGVRASLNVQIDGEAMPRITEATIIHVYPQSGQRVYVRCLKSGVVN